MLIGQQHGRPGRQREALRAGVPVLDRDARSRSHARVAPQLRRFDGVHVCRTARSGVHARTRHDRLGDGLHAREHRRAGRTASGRISRIGSGPTTTGRSSTATRRCTSDDVGRRAAAACARSPPVRRSPASPTAPTRMPPGRTRVDPRIQRFDLSSDPLAFARDQFRIDDDLAARLTHRYPRRHAQLSGPAADVDQRPRTTTWRNISIAARYIGGVYTSRSHRGQPGGSPPFTPVPRAEQRRAFESDRPLRALVARVELSARAAQRRGAGALRRRLGSARRPADRFPDSRGRRRSCRTTRSPSLFNPASISRIADESLKEPRPGRRWTWPISSSGPTPRSSTTSARTTIAPHASRSAAAFRRPRDADRVPAAATMDQLGVPREMQSLARYELREIRGAARRGLSQRDRRRERARTSTTCARASIRACIPAPASALDSSDPAAARSDARSARRSARHGHRQRHARLVLRSGRRVSTTSSRARARSPPPAARWSTSAANRTRLESARRAPTKSARASSRPSSAIRAAGIDLAISVDTFKAERRRRGAGSRRAR